LNIKRIIGYIGSKVNLYDFIEDIVVEPNKNKKLFIDLFAGTCAVSKLVKEKTNMDIMTNDLALYSKILTSELKIEELNEKSFKKIEELLIRLDNLPLIKGDFYHEFSMGGTPKTIKDKKVFEVSKKEKDEEGNVISEISENYQEYSSSRMFFKGEVGEKIDTIKSELKRLYVNKEIDEETKDLVLLFLLSYANTNANNTSVYGAYLKHDKQKTIKPFLNKELLKYIKEKYNKYKNSKRKIYSFHNYADKTIKEIKKNYTKYKSKDIIVYWDPPYSSRSYESNYHILEYLCDLNFNIGMIKENSKTGMKKNEIKYDNPFTSKVKTPKIFKDLIKDSLELSDLMYISYNNEGLITESKMEEIIEELNKDYFQSTPIKLKTTYQEYKRFTSGENNGINNDKKNTVLEIIWCISK